MAAIMLTAVTLCNVGSGLINITIAGSDRPDFLEIFGGNAEVSRSFPCWGWWSLEPVDICYGVDGVDLRNESEREELLHRIEHYRPRLVVVSYPRTLYSPRERERPFLEFCKEVLNDKRKGETMHWGKIR